MSKYRLGYHKDSDLGRTDSIEEARRMAVKIYNGLDSHTKKVFVNKISIYSGKKHYGEVIFVGCSCVDSKGNLMVSDAQHPCYHKSYSKRVPQPFNPKTGKLL